MPAPERYSPSVLFDFFLSARRSRKACGPAPLLFAVVFAMSLSASGERRKMLSIGSRGTGGVYSAPGGGFADLPSAQLLRHRAATEVTGRSVGSPSSATALLKSPFGYTVLAMVNALIGIAAWTEGVQNWFVGQTSRIVRVTTDRLRVADGIGVARVIAVVVMLELRKS
jgi:hypothetical protein